jgi:hypothetical protein
MKEEINRDAMLEVAHELIDLIVDKDIQLRVDGGIKAPVKYEDGAYKMKPIMGGWEFFLEYAYIGAKDMPIFGMSTPDAEFGGFEPQWKTAELNEKHMDDAFPLLLSELGKYIEVRDTFGETVKYHYNRKVAASKLDMETSEDKLRSLPTFGMF